MLNFLEIDKDSKIPKYKQLVDTILSDIENGIFRIGDRIPSINETSEEFYLSRDTVEKAYRILRERGIISSVRGKGFYVASTGVLSSKRILLVFNKLSDHKKAIQREESSRHLESSGGDTFQFEDSLTIAHANCPILGVAQRNTGVD